MSSLGDIMLLDLDLCHELDDLVEKLTTSGQQQLAPEECKRLKSICRTSDDYVKKCFHLVMKQLEKGHSEIRFSALLLCNELFTRSHCFRDLLLSDFKYFMELTLETEPDYPLPPPVRAAKALKSKAAEFIQQWHIKFGGVYKQISLGYHFLRECKKIKFSNSTVVTAPEAERQRERAAREHAQKAEKLSKTVQEMKDMTDEIKVCLTQAENCLTLLLPDPDDFEIHGLKSPEIFRKADPWNRDKCKHSKHVNKSTKGKTSSTTDKSSAHKYDQNEEIVTVKCEPQHNGRQRKHVNKSTKGKTSSTSEKSPDARSAQGDEVTMNCESHNKSKQRKLHVNKSTKSKTPSPSVTDKSSDNKSVQSDDITVKCEPLCQSQATSSTAPSENVTSTVVKLESDLPLAEEKNSSTPEDTTKDCVESVSPEDVKPSQAELEAAIETFKAQKSSESVLSGHDTSTQGDTSKSDEEDFQEISSSDEDSSSEDSDANEDHQEDRRRHGLSSQTYSISISMIPEAIQIPETSDNHDLILTLEDCIRLIDGKFSPAITRWLEIFAKVGAEQTDISKALDIKQALSKLKEKVAKVNVVKAPKLSLPAMKSGKPKNGVKPDADDSDEDSESDDFQEVTSKEGYEPCIPDHLREEYGLVNKPPKPPTNPDWALPQQIAKDEEDPASVMSTLKAMKRKIKHDKGEMSEPPSVGDANAESEPKPGPSTPRKKKATRSDVPVVPFGMDLYHWGGKIETPLVVRYDDQHRFMAVVDDGVAKVDWNALESMKTRVINYTGKFERVKWSCRAPLPSGKLCPRMDRVKCPFHGKIVPRDEKGDPVNPEDFLRIQQEEEAKRAEKTPEWDDPAFQAEIEKATGVELQRKHADPKDKGKGKGKKKKERRRKYPGLTDINKVHNTSRRRLENKVLSRAALTRVAEAMDRLDKRRRLDKFGNNFIRVHRQ